MSRRIKRLERKARFVSSLELDKLTLEASIEHAQKAIEEAHGFLAKIEEQKNLLDEYVNKNEDSQIILKKELLNDNTELEILVVQEDRTIIVSTLGFVAKAKAHELDEFDFEIGYSLALNRLLTELLNFANSEE